MRPETLERRLDWLRKNRFKVLRLDEAIDRLHFGRIGLRETVITIDDGFFGVYALAAPILRAYDVPATIYSTTYYVKHQTPVFRLAIQYMAWKSKRAAIDVSGLIRGVDGWVAKPGAENASILQRLYESGEKLASEDERFQVARAFSERADVSFDELVESRRLSLMSKEELFALQEQGFDVQLHTHRHRLPLAPDEISRELTDNRAILRTITARPLVHLCYPSGHYDRSQWEQLSALGIRSATTCESGFNSPRAELFRLKRFLDADYISLGEFAAEMSGIKQTMRSVQTFLPGALRRSGSS